MKKLKIGDLERIREKVKRTAALRLGRSRGKVTVHMGTCGIAAGAREILTSLMQEIKRKKLEDLIITTSGCAGLCSREPMVTVELTDKAPVKYGNLTAAKIKKIVGDHLLKGKVVSEYVLALGSERTH